MNYRHMSILSRKKEKEDDEEEEEEEEKEQENQEQQKRKRQCHSLCFPPTKHIPLSAGFTTQRHVANMGVPCRRPLKAGYVNWGIIDVYN